MNSELLQTLSGLLATHPQADQLLRSLSVLVRLTEVDPDRLDWEILAATIEDLEQGYRVFAPYRHQRKLTLFGSARLPGDSPEYQMAQAFSAQIAQHGFLVMTGAGGGIMAAGNSGAGPENSFGLHIPLPSEEQPNSFIDSESKGINFRYFFTRKLFFLKECDAIAAFPGGLGTQDEIFECLTLAQTGRFGPVPIILLDHPRGNYWQQWQTYVSSQLIKRGLANTFDRSLYRITNNLDTACHWISDFYRIYQSSRYVDEQWVMRLKAEPTEAILAKLNTEFADVLLRGDIRKSAPLIEEQDSSANPLPRLVLTPKRGCAGRLFALIYRLNELMPPDVGTEHPEIRQG
ncbi:MAG: LOG family protein [Cyanobacteria bacterium P01_H01_bin.15]